MRQAEALKAGADPVERARSMLRRQWRPVVLPAIALWTVAAIAAGTLVSSFDIQEYARYAHAALQAPLFHRLPLEYPAPAVGVFLLPLLLPIAYPWAFAVFVGVVLVALLMTYDTPGLPGLDVEGAGRLIAYLALGGVMFFTARYDLFAMAAMFWSYRAARRDRWSAAWAWSAVGFALKLFPAVMWPVLLIAEWRETRRVPARRLLWMAGSGALLVGLPALLNHKAAVNVAHYYLHRPTETGSVAAGLSVLADWSHLAFVVTFHSLNVLSAASGPISTVLEVAGAVGCAAVWWLYARGRLTMEAAVLASLTCVVLGSKVLSVQYVMWLMPFWALYRVRPAWALACVLNTVVFPFSSWLVSYAHATLHAYGISLTLTYFARDLLIAAGTLAWLREALDEPIRAPVEGGGLAVGTA